MSKHIWVDADACPAVIKDIPFRVAERVPVEVTLVANQLIRVSGSRFIRVQAGDLVVTGDIPLSPRGDWHTKDTIAQQLTMRAFMDELRGSGVDTGGPPAFSQADRQKFWNALDRATRGLHQADFFLVKYPG